MVNQHLLSTGFCLLATTLLSLTTVSQTATFNQNASRSNHTRLSFSADEPTWQMTFKPYFSKSLGTNSDSTQFRGNGTGFSMNTDYFISGFGLGFSAGFQQNQPDESEIRSFVTRTGLSPDELFISSSPQQNMFLLIGPVFRSTGPVQLTLQLKGGMFVNNGGLISLSQRQGDKAFYRTESSDKSIFPGFTGGAGVNYSTNTGSWSFGLSADYMYTQSRIINYDVRRNGGIEGISQSPTCQQLNFGISVTKYFTDISRRGYTSSSKERDSGSSISSGRRNRETGSSISSGRRNRETGSGISSGRRQYQPLSVFITDNPSVASRNNDEFFNEQNPSPEKKQAIVGSIVWTPAAPLKGIINNGNYLNQNQTSPNSLGTVLHLSSRESASGIASGRRSGEKGSGIATGKRSGDNNSGRATGRRQYTPAYSESWNDSCINCGIKVQLLAHEAAHVIQQRNNNPVYNGNGKEVNNPIYEPKLTTAGSGNGELCGVTSHFIVMLTDTAGNVKSVTKATPCGEFWFDNVPEGKFRIKTSGEMVLQKVYDITLTNQNGIDLLGELEWNDDWMGLVTETGRSPEIQKGNNNTTLANPTRKTGRFFLQTGDADGDEHVEIAAGNRFTGGEKLYPGMSMKGIDINLMSNGKIIFNTETDSSGRFELKGLTPGNYQIVIETRILVEDVLNL